MKLREEVRWLGEHYQGSQQRLCGLMQIAVSSYRYRSTRSDAALRERLVELARKKPRWGYRRLHILLTGSGMSVNHKRVFRVYREAGLAVRRKARKRLVREGSPQPLLTAANQEWAVDFAHDALANGSGLLNLFLTPLAAPCAHACPVRVEVWVHILSSKPRPSLFINLLDSPRAELLH